MTTDLTVANHGSIFVLTAVSDAGKEWVAEHLPEDAMTWGPNGYVVEHRYIGDIVNGARDDGMEVE